VIPQNSSVLGNHLRASLPLPSGAWAHLAYFKSLLRDGAGPPADAGVTDRQRPMATASFSRCFDGDPRNSFAECARLKYKCAGCSQVNPMPPWI
jgi:hypothetical protein